MALIIGVAVLWSAVGVCSEKEERRRELAHIQATIRTVKKSLDAMESQKSALEVQLRQIERQYGVAAKAHRELEQKAQVQRQQLKESARHRDRLRQFIHVQLQALGGQIRAAHAAGRQERIKLMLNQQQPAKVSRILTYYDYFNRARLAKIRAIEMDLDELMRIERALKLESERLEALLAHRKNEQESLTRLRQERNRVLAEVDAQLRDKQSQLKGLLRDEERLQSLVASIQRAMDDFPLDPGPSGPFAELRGRLAWPVRGKVSKGFGARRAGSYWDGVLIEAPEGAEVRAVSAGRVAYADWLRGYGLLTIIDHGNGYMTLYAFNQSLYKGVGDRVNGGEVIASVGRSGGRAHPGLYFGIRRGGKPEDPAKWCRPVRNGRVG